MNVINRMSIKAHPVFIMCMKKQPDFLNPAENHFLKNLSKKDFFFE